MTAPNKARAGVIHAGPGTTQPDRSLTLVSQDGTRWIHDADRPSTDPQGWHPEGTDVSLRWSSPAMAHAGPFAVERRRNP